MDRIFESIGKPLQVNGTKRLTGPFTVLGVFNQNGRRYPDKVYEEAYQELIPKIKSKRLMGELDHPMNYDEVRLSNVSHVIVSCSIRESASGKKVVYGTVELLDTPAGKIAQALVKAGIPLGISSRALGNTKQVNEGIDVVQLKLITYDLVAEPSFSTAILSEEKKSELSENLSFIESKIPLNESKNYETLRSQITRIRESLCSPETNSGVEAHIDIKSINTQTLEINALKSLLESKKSLISKDTERLKESRSEIKSLRSKLSESHSRYDNLHSNHQKLQESYNAIKQKKVLEESKKISELEAEVVELRKRLAVEQRGMSYAQISSLLEGVVTDAEISNKLDTISHMRKKSNEVTHENVLSIRESLATEPNRSKLSRIISKV